MAGFRRFLTIVVAGAVLIVVAMVMFGPSSSQRQRTAARFGNPDGPVPVLAAEARIADVPVYLDGVGTTRALNMVTIHSQVDGTLISVNFREGQDVKTGDVLARIDSTTYQAQLDQALAKKALDEAQLANVRLDLERYSNLLKTNAVNRQQVDTTRALVAQLEAQVRLDQGAIDNARAYVNYCTIVAPISARVGIRLVDQGNLVHASDPTGIAVLTQIQPISVLFTLPQQQLGQVNKAFAKAPLSVEATVSDSKQVLDRGTLQVVNNQVDQTTGTVQLKAEFPNADLQLWPGQFVNVRLLIDTLRQVVVVPTAAVQRGPNGTFVYLLQPDSTVSVRLVGVSQQDESQTVIANGLQAKDRVVTSGFAQLADGRKVAVSGAAGAPGAMPSPGNPGDPGARPPRRERGAGKTSEATGTPPSTSP
ncbi:MAG TPA: efflux RND transporter periplasmic adaptor subunit [Xanthobacteraceae bacterium]